MKRTTLLLAGTLASAAAASATAIAPLASAHVAPSAPVAHSSRAVKISLRQTSVGKVLVENSGFTVFRFTRDASNKNACMSISKCSQTWPSLTTTGTPTAGPGVKASLLSTIRLSNGSQQVTYAGHPLYRYSLAGEAGETSYVGATEFGGTWDGVSASGGLVK
jgi:predicted lipoprotein with Yx(FWY)xxD motif